MPPRAFILSIAIALSFGARSASGDSIRLHPTARVDPDAPVTLGDVAALDGEIALSLGSLVITPSARDAADGKAWIEITTDQIRDALDLHGAPQSRLSLAGGRCLVRLSVIDPVAMVESGPEPDLVPRPAVVDDLSGASIRSQVAASIARLVGAEQSNVRLLFERRDESLLSQTTWGRRVAIQPTTSASSRAIVVEVRIFSGSGAELLERRRLRVTAEVRRTVIVLQHAVRRGVALKAGDVEVREQWISVDGSTPLTGLDGVVGAIATRRIDAGDILRSSDLEPPILIRRGEMVTVHCLHLGFAVRSRARAVADGRLGEMIELKLDGSKRAFVARVNGRAEAVLDLDQHDEPEISDAR